MKLRCVVAPMVVAGFLCFAGWVFKWNRVNDKKDRELKEYQKQLEMIYCKEGIWTEDI